VPADDPNQEERWVRLPIGFPPELHEWLRETAHRRRTKMAELVRQAVLEYREREEPQMSMPVKREKK
jgi:hypothetical protein